MKLPHARGAVVCVGVGLGGCAVGVVVAVLVPLAEGADGDVEVGVTVPVTAGGNVDVGVASLVVARVDVGLVVGSALHPSSTAPTA
jgi:hypothetical protein